jgi:hypothetical protein
MLSTKTECERELAAFICVCATERHLSPTCAPTQRQQQCEQRVRVPGRLQICATLVCDKRALLSHRGQQAHLNNVECLLRLQASTAVARAL